MIRHSALLFLGTLPFVAAYAQPVISSQGPVNAASYRTPGLSASGIAQGSAFTIFGTGLGPNSYAQADSFPLPTTLAGTSVTVTVGTTVTPAIVILAFNNQVNAILPSTTPAAQLSLQFAAFETIHTENSYKFTRHTLGTLLDDAGFTVEQMWTDPRQWYSLTLAGVR